MAAGLGLNVFNRQADKLYMCNIAQMVNVLQSVLLADGPEGSNCVRTANSYAFLLFKPHRMEVDCALRGVTAKQGRAQILHDPDLNACNSFEQPERVVIKPHAVAVEGGRLRITLPSLSVAVVSLEVAS